MKIQASDKHRKIIKVGLLLAFTGLISTCIYIFAGQLIARGDKRPAVRPAKVSVCMPVKKVVKSRNQKK